MYKLPCALIAAVLMAVAFHFYVIKRFFPTVARGDIASMCQIDHTDGLLVRAINGDLIAFVVINNELWQEGEFVPCRSLKRNRAA